MGYLRRLNPLRAFADLRRFLASRGRHEIVFVFVALAICYAMIAAFAFGTRVDKPWVRPDIIYVQSWRADRSAAEIRAQQKIDTAKQKAEDEAEAAFEAKKRAQFKRALDQQGPWL